MSDYDTRLKLAHRMSAECSVKCRMLGWNVFYWRVHWAVRKCRSK